MDIEVFCDGSATTAQKPGGWAWVLIVDGEKHSEGSGHAELASNNDMELAAAIQGLAAALKHVNDETDPRATTVDMLPDYTVTLCSDSQLVLGWASGQYKFKQEAKFEKYNQLSFLMKRLKAKTKWIKGHSGHIWNERCDELANLARKGRPKTEPAIGQTKIGTKRNGVIAIWYGNQLKLVDMENNVVENHSRDLHGSRASVLEIRTDKHRSSE